MFCEVARQTFTSGVSWQVLFWLVFPRLFGHVNSFASEKLSGGYSLSWDASWILRDCSVTNRPKKHLRPRLHLFAGYSLSNDSVLTGLSRSVWTLPMALQATNYTAGILWVMMLLEFCDIVRLLTGPRSIYDPGCICSLGILWVMIPVWLVFPGVNSFASETISGGYSLSYDASWILRHYSVTNRPKKHLRSRLHLFAGYSLSNDLWCSLKASDRWIFFE